jgi:anti-sigma B factor antagonist
MDDIDPVEDPGPDMAFELGREPDGAPVISLRGELDMANVDRLDETMRPVLSTDPDRLVVDVSRLEFADSSAIAKLVLWNKSVRSMEVRGASPLLRRILSAMGLDEMLRLT